MRVAVIGAGASGCMAALASSGKHNEVLLFDGNRKIGKKIYATGNGRCNLTNKRQSPDCYFSSTSSGRAWEIINRFSSADIMHFFESRGILLHSRGDYVYPETGQAATIARFFELELKKAGVKMYLESRVEEIRQNPDGTFQIQAGGKTFQADRAIVSCGGLAGKQFGCTGDGFRFAGELGHTVLEPLPALTSLCVRENSIRRAAGVRCAAAVTLSVSGRPVRREEGELQVTKKGLSGIVVFQLSRTASLALLRKEEVSVTVDFLPQMRGREEEWESEKKRRLAGARDMMAADWMLGLANRGVIDMVLDSHGIASEKKASRLSEDLLEAVLDGLRSFRFHVCGTGGFENAQTTAGGVPLDELSDDMESLIVPGLYITGETADVDGLCGGYNLTWAFSTGHTAGKAAGKEKT